MTSTTTTTPAIAGWFTTGNQPALLGSRCETCGAVSFPKRGGLCPDPGCAGEEFTEIELSRRGRIWSYTDARYQPPAPYISEGEQYRPFALAAVELPEGLVVLGQVGAEVELVVEPLYTDSSGQRTIWRWKPTKGAA